MSPHDVVKFSKISTLSVFALLFVVIIASEALFVLLFTAWTIMILLYGIANSVIYSLYWWCYNCQARLPRITWNRKILYCPKCAADVEESYKKHRKDMGKGE